MTNGFRLKALHFLFFPNSATHAGLAFSVRQTSSGFLGMPGNPAAKPRPESRGRIRLSDKPQALFTFFKAPDKTALTKNI
jgi:hypothetical protein